MDGTSARIEASATWLGQVLWRGGLLLPPSLLPSPIPGVLVPNGDTQSVCREQLGGSERMDSYVGFLPRAFGF